MIGAPLPIQVHELFSLLAYNASIPTGPSVGTRWRRHASRHMRPYPASGIMVAQVLPADDDSNELPILWREALLMPKGGHVEETVGGWVGCVDGVPGRSVYAFDVRDVVRGLWGIS